MKNDDYDEQHEQLPDIIELDVDGSATKLIFNKIQKRTIEELIVDHYDHSFPLYCERVGIKPPNFYATLNGGRPCSLEFLNKLLSGIGYQASIQATLTLQPYETGPDALGAVSIEQEDEWLLKDKVDQDESDS